MVDAIQQTPILPRNIIGKAKASTPASATERGQTIPKDTLNVLNTSIEALRQTNQVPQAIRELISAEGTFSASVFDFVEVASGTYKVAAYDTGTHQFNPEATRLAESVLASIDTLYDYSKGFSDKQTLQNLIDMSLLEVICTGALCHELVLTKERLPDRINCFPYDTVEWVSRGDGTRFPQQTSSTGDPIKLDLPTVFISDLHRFSNKAYARSMMEPAINGSYQYQGFMEEVRKAVRRSGHSRLRITLDAAKVTAAAPPEIRNDSKKLLQWMEDVKSTVEETVKTLEPEDAIVMYDSATAELIKGEGEKSDYVPLINAISGALATSLKVSPSIIGLRITGSQSLSNTESLIFLKVAKAIRKPVEDNLSRALTLAVRLYGADVYVVFYFDPINLRPEDELEAFKTMQQDRIMKLLSEGFISDDEAAFMLGTGARPPGAPPLMGTGFARKSGGIDASNASPNDDPQGRALQSDQPTNAGGESQ